MATIGTFTSNANGFAGTIKTLNLNVKARIERIENTMVGEIEVSSELAVGTTFRIHLPSTTHERAQETPSAPPEARRAPASSGSCPGSRRRSTSSTPTAPGTPRPSCPSSARWMSIAACTAAVTDENSAMTPSPVLFTTRPPRPSSPRAR